MPSGLRGLTHGGAGGQPPRPHRPRGTPGRARGGRARALAAAGTGSSTSTVGVAGLRGLLSHARAKVTTNEAARALRCVHGSGAYASMGGQVHTRWRSPARVVDASDRRPELARPRSRAPGTPRRSREYGCFQSLDATASAVCGACLSGLSSRGSLPSSTARISSRMRDHRLAEAVELLLRLALGRLHHQRAGDGEAHGRRVEAVVHQPLGDVVHLDARGALHAARVEDALVRDAPALAAVEDREVRVQPVGDVVRVEDGDLARALQPVRRPSSRCTPTR